MPEVSSCPLHSSMIFMNVDRLVWSILSATLATACRTQVVILPFTAHCMTIFC